MARRLAIICSVGLSGCSLIVDPSHYQLCETPHPPRCDGDQLVVCRGELEVREACSDGCDPISTACVAPLCGNGTLDPDEVCDDQNQQSGDGCRGDCGKIEDCGDGTFDLGEPCDDGNTTDGDGCDCRPPDILVNTTRAEQQERPGVAVLADGTALVVFDDASETAPDSSGTAIRGRLVRGPAPVGDDRILNTQVAFEQTTARVVASAGGTAFLAVWTDGSGAAPDTLGTAIRARVLDELLSASTADFVVNSTVTGDQADPAVAPLPDGGYLVAWADGSGADPDTSGTSIRAQRLDAGGEPVGPEEPVNTTADLDQGHVAVASCPDGTVLFAWEDRSVSPSDPSGSAIRGRRMAPDGSFLDAGDFAINTTTARDQEIPALVCTPSGDFLVAWSDTSPAPADLGDVRARLIPATGLPVDDDYIVNSTRLGQQEYPALVALPDRILIAFEDASGLEPDTSENAVRLRWLGADGQPGPSEDFVINTLVALDQGEPALAARGDSTVIVVWEDESLTPPDDLADAVRMKIVHPP